LADHKYGIAKAGTRDRLTMARLGEITVDHHNRKIEAVAC
jgi:hypothetical protein